MKNKITFWIVLLILLNACNSTDTAQLNNNQDVNEKVQSESVELIPAEVNEIVSESLWFNDFDIAPPDLSEDSSDLVSASGNCQSCHSNLEDENGDDISFDSFWRSSMMANAAIDPYWIATVSSEVYLEPELSEVIEDKCSTCHMPLAHFDAKINNKNTEMFGEGFLNPENPLHDLAMDGISCTLCHQIEGENFKQADSFSGGYLLNKTDRAWGERFSYGPFPISEKAAGAMLQSSGYQAVQSEHMTDSALCGTCHNLYTPYLDANGAVIGEFPEQMTYKEWENSDFENGESCQDCHMPKVDGPVKISSILGKEQDYLKLHSFTGANSYMINMLKENAEELEVRAEEDQLDNAIEITEEQMQNDVGTVLIESLEISEGQLLAEVVVQNEVGHKFPTGYPSRRVWVHFSVIDGDGNLIFDSGNVESNGLINGNDNDLDPAAYEPHYEIIDDPQEVQIYETILANSEGEVTTVLLRAALYAKDNRLLPLGFDPGSVSDDIAVNGKAQEDENFVGGSDSLMYQISLKDAKGPYTVKVELLYQTIGYRWANNLDTYGLSETELFIEYYEAMDNLPLIIDQLELIVE